MTFDIGISPGCIRGEDIQQSELFSYRSLEERVTGMRGRALEEILQIVIMVDVAGAIS